MSQNLPVPVLQGSPVEESTLYELKVYVHEPLKRVDRLEKAVKGLQTGDPGALVVDPLRNKP